MLDTDAGFGDAMVARLKKFLLRSKVEIERLEWRCLALRGAGVDAAAAGLRAALGRSRRAAICRSSGTAGRGIDLLGPKDVVLDPAAGPLPEGIIPVRAGRRRGLPDRLGHPGHGQRAHRQDDRRRGGPGGAVGELHQGLLHRSGAGRPARFAGQQRAPPPRRRRGRPDADPDADRLAFGMTLHAGPRSAMPPATPATDADRRRPTWRTDKVVGTVTSAAWSPELGAWIALAYLHRTVEAPGPVRVRSGDGLGGAQPARVALLPRLDRPARELELGIRAHPLRRTAGRRGGATHSIAASTTPFTLPADVLTGLAIVAMAVLVCVRWPLRTRKVRAAARRLAASAASTGRPYLPWIAVADRLRRLGALQLPGARDPGQSPDLQLHHRRHRPLLPAQDAAVPGLAGRRPGHRPPGLSGRSEASGAAVGASGAGAEAGATVSVSTVSYIVWGALGVAVLVLWGLSYLRPTAVATPRDVVGRLATLPIVRVVLVLGFMWLGWHLFAR